jgi:hypothetical protein
LAGRSIDFLVQAVNGVGLVSLDDNLGRTYSVLGAGQTATQTITIAAPSIKTLGDPDFAVSAAASSGLPVTLSAAGSCTVSGTTVHITAIGTCTLTGTQAGNGTYGPATATATINVRWPFTGFFSPIDNDGVINSADRVIIGRHRNFPKWSGGFSNRFEFGAFDLSSLIVARWGYTVDLGFLPGAMAGRYNQLALDYWTPENPTNAFPRPNSDQEQALDETVLRLVDGSHWRVRNITLGFDVPSSLTSRIGDNAGLRIYAQAQDPFVFTAVDDFPGFDPEDDGTLGVPSYRTLLIGASVNF